MSNNGTLKRDPSMDIVRCVALYLVISVHFCLNSGFYSEVVQSGTMYAMTILRTAFMACVPLFCILSGYLLGGKRLQRGYYRGIKKTLITYLLASGANLIWRIWFLKENLSFRQSVLGILNFTAAPYSWYIEMYIGLFILVPFLNVLYHNLPEKKQKQGLLITLVVLTALPSVVNIYDFTTRGGGYCNRG